MNTYQFVMDSYKLVNDEEGNLDVCRVTITLTGLGKDVVCGMEQFQLIAFKLLDIARSDWMRALEDLNEKLA